MKFGKIVKLGLFCFLLMNLCFAYAKDLEPQEYEEYVISDPQEPSPTINDFVFCVWTKYGAHVKHKFLYNEANAWPDEIGPAQDGCFEDGGIPVFVKFQ